MQRVLRLSRLPLLVIAVGMALSYAPVMAQDSDPSCSALYDAVVTGMMAHCFGRESGTVCGASDSVSIQMQSGQVVSGAGSAARLSGVASLQSEPGDGTAWSLASIYLPDMLDSQKYAALIALGPVALRFEPDPKLPAGAAFTLSGGTLASSCSNLPRPGVLVQSAANSLTLLRVNGVDLAVNGTTLIQPLDGSGLYIAALARETILSQTGTVIFAGYSAQVSGTTVSQVVPYDPGAVAHLPVEILPEMEVVTLPGNAIVLQDTNLCKRPAAETYTTTMVKAELPVNVLGRNSGGDWLVIRTYDGAVGWIPASVLQVNVPVELPVYDATPPLPVRPFGSIQAYVKTSAEHNNLRTGPGESYPIAVTVPIWTDLALYGRSQDDQWLLVETEDNVRAWISVSLISPSTPYALDKLPFAPGYGG
jgi:SH3-like domain-containing protein